MNIGDLPTRNALGRPHATAFTCCGTNLTWSEVERRSNALAAHLHSLPVGQRVLLLGKNCHRYWEAHFACAKAGLIALPVNHRLTASEIYSLIRDAGAVGAIIDLNVEASTNLSSFPFRLKVSYRSGNQHGDEGEDVEIDWSAIAPRRSHPINVIGYTSGTTGRTKGAVVEHRASFLTSIWLCALWGLKSSDVFLACMPAYVFRGGTAGMAAPLIGARTVPVDFDAVEVLRVAEQEHVTHLNLAPIMVDRLLSCSDLDSCDLSAIRSIWIGGSPPSADSVRALASRLGAMERGVTIGGLYGMTEAPCIAAARWSLGDDTSGTERLGSAGRPTPLYEVRLSAGSGAGEAEDANVGELLVRGDSLMNGYWGDDEGGALKHGWFATGDIVRRHDDGSLTIVDRRSDVIVSGGLNVYSAEIERVMLEHPDILSSAVVGMPDDEWGEAVCAFVVVRPGLHDVEDVLNEHFRERLAGFKRPRKLFVVDSIPLTEGDKPDKQSLRARLNS